MRESLDFEKQFNFAIVNGVLEWIPTQQDVVVRDYYSTKSEAINDSDTVDPYRSQLNFLKQVSRHLKDDGRLYLAIENRYDYQYYL